MKPVDAQIETARQVGRVASAIEEHNRQDAEFERELDAVRDVPRVMGAMRRGLVRNLVRTGLFHTSIPRAAWSASGDGLTVRCNCGEEHALPADAFCERVGCGRFFLFDGADVRVAVRPPS